MKCTLSRLYRVGYASFAPQPCLSRALVKRPAGTWKRGHSSPSQHDRPTSSASASSKAGILLIGDEILSGKVVDTNASWLCTLLHDRGVEVSRIEVVGDNLEEIQDSVKRIKSRVGDGPVFTSGGIGPTHDDVTYQAIAAAFGVDLVLHEPTLERMALHYQARGLEMNEMRKRMALLPESSEVLVTEGTWVPLAVVQGVHILPGIPRLFQSISLAHIHRFSGAKVHELELYTCEAEGDFAAVLATIAARNGAVKIGSYPRTDVSHNTDIGTYPRTDTPPHDTCPPHTPPVAHAQWRVRLLIQGRRVEDVVGVGELIKSVIKTHIPILPPP